MIEVLFDFQQSTTVFPPLQPLEQSSQIVVSQPLSQSLMRSRPDELFPVPTVKAVPISGDESNEYTAFVLPDSDSPGIFSIYNSYKFYATCISLFL